MKKDNLYEPFELVLKEPLEVCPRGIHKHSFFELVYIVSGTGRQYINQAVLSYHEGDLFLLAPDDTHYFEMETATQLFFIRFNDNYIKSESRQHELLQRLEMILKNVSHDPGSILKNEPDHVVVKTIVEALIREHLQHDLYHKDLIAQYVNTLLVIVARNISLNMPGSITENSEQKAVDILQYIQANICEPGKLRVEHLSSHFGISETYFGHYFKKHSSESLQQYIMNYKMKLVENRLLYSNMRIAEIADEFGFTDKSHLSRIFKKYRGLNPTDYRKAPKPIVA